MNDRGEIRELAPGENPGPGWIRLPEIPDRFDEKVGAIAALAASMPKVAPVSETESSRASDRRLIRKGSGASRMEMLLRRG